MSMNRREFLKGLAASSAAGLVGLGPFGGALADTLVTDPEKRICVRLFGPWEQELPELPSPDVVVTLDLFDAPPVVLDDAADCVQLLHSALDRPLDASSFSELLLRIDCLEYRFSIELPYVEVWRRERLVRGSAIFIDDQEVGRAWFNHPWSVSAGNRLNVTHKRHLISSVHDARRVGTALSALRERDRVHSIVLGGAPVDRNQYMGLFRG